MDLLIKFKKYKSSGSYYIQVAMGELYGYCELNPSCSNHLKVVYLVVKQAYVYRRQFQLTQICANHFYELYGCDKYLVRIESFKSYRRTLSHNQNRSMLFGPRNEFQKLPANLSA